MRFLALALGALMLTACVTVHNPWEMRARQALSDHWDCKDYGFEQGTEFYAQCRMDIAQNRETRQAVSRAASMPLVSGVICL